MARSSKPIDPPPAPELLDQAARDLAHLQDRIGSEQWSRLVRCKAMAKAQERRRRAAAREAPPSQPAEAPARPGTPPRTARRPAMVPAQRQLFDPRRAAANDLEDDDAE